MMSYHRHDYRNMGRHHAEHAVDGRVVLEPPSPHDTTWQETPMGRAEHLTRRLFNECHMTAAQACALVGGMMHESDDLKPNINQGGKIGKPLGKGGYGYAQWTGERQEAFIAYCAQNKLNPQSPVANEDYVIKELQSPHFAQRIRQTNQLSKFDEIVKEVTSYFESPKATLAHLEVRLEYAEKVAKHFGEAFYANIVKGGSVLHGMFFGNPAHAATPAQPPIKKDDPSAKTAPTAPLPSTASADPTAATNTTNTLPTSAGNSVSANNPAAAAVTANPTSGVLNSVTQKPKPLSHPQNSPM